MRALVVHHGLEEALKSAKILPNAVKDKEKLLQKAYSMIILNLGDEILKKVLKEKTTKGIWTKLEGLYMKKSLVDHRYLKQALYSFKIREDKFIDEQLDEINKLILDLENIGVNIEDEDQALLLLSSLSISYTTFKDKLFYGRISYIG